VQRITFEIITRAVLGIESESRRAQLLALLEPVFTASALIDAPIVRADLGPLSPGGRFRRAMARLDNALLGLIADRRSSPRGHDVLALLLDSHDSNGRPLSPTATSATS